jgi:hypothetical protein
MDTVHVLTEKQLHNICRVILDEDFKSTPRSVCHMRGLIPYCQQNPELSIERHIGLTNLLPAGNMKESGGNRTFITGSEMLNAIVPWIKETLNLPAHGMPINAFHLFIDGSSRESVEVWEILKNAAAMQDAMLK